MERRRIEILKDEDISKIAAGEVVERPDAILKELFENAADAGSTSIFVEIEGGGKDRIFVSDNGFGIAAEDLPLTFLRHATSKIRSISDLYRLHTMGFRGEALYSIAAVSKVVLTTRTKDDAAASRIETAGGVLTKSDQTAANVGTSVEVTDLFFNTPVRWKFLRTTSQETRSCIELMSKLAVSHPHISVTFQSDGALVFKTDGSSDLMSAVFQVYGRSVSEDLMPISYESDDIRITGLASRFSLRKRNRSYIHTFVNGRYVKSGELQKAIEGCYRPHLMGGEFPVTFLFLEVPAGDIDVNVHPSKTEVKFADFQKVGHALSAAIKRSFSLHSHIPSAAKNTVFTRRFGEPETSDPVFDVFTERGIPLVAEPVSDYVSESVSLPVSDLRSDHVFLPVAEENRSFLSAEGGGLRSSAVPPKREVGKWVQKELTAESDPRNFLSRSRVIGVFDATFILAEYDRELYLIDQHAAHEKILFEEYTDAVRDKAVHAQQLLIPFEIHIGRGVEIIDLSDMGFETLPFGESEIIVRAIPTGMTEHFAGKFLESIYQERWEEETPYDLATKACKAAIKGGDVLMEIEIQTLIDRLSRIRDPYNCPHGRPVIVKITRREVDRMFKRIL